MEPALLDGAHRSLICNFETKKNISLDHLIQAFVSWNLVPLVG